MEDMATGEIRVSILWEWLHKAAALTEGDPTSASGGHCSRRAVRPLLDEEYAKLQRRRQSRRPRRLEADDAADRAGDREDVRESRRSCRGSSIC